MPGPRHTLRHRHAGATAHVDPTLPCFSCRLCAVSPFWHDIPRGLPAASPRCDNNTCLVRCRPRAPPDALLAVATHFPVGCCPQTPIQRPRPTLARPRPVRAIAIVYHSPIGSSSCPRPGPFCLPLAPLVRLKPRLAHSRLAPSTTPSHSARPLSRPRSPRPIPRPRVHPTLACAICIGHLLATRSHLPPGTSALPAPPSLPCRPRRSDRAPHSQRPQRPACNVNARSGQPSHARLALVMASRLPLSSLRPYGASSIISHRSPLAALHSIRPAYRGAKCFCIDMVIDLSLQRSAISQCHGVARQSCCPCKSPYTHTYIQPP